MTRLIEWLLMRPCDKVVKVKSWKPAWGKYGMEWPAMLVDMNGYRRVTATPVWNWPLVRGIFRGHH
jgi:hypothetical protein